MSEPISESIPSADEVNAWADEAAAQTQTEQRAEVVEAESLPADAELDRLADPE